MLETVPIYGLTLYQPWAWAIAEGYKKIENRPWAPPPSVLANKSFIAIHAGVKYDHDGFHFLSDRLGLRVPYNVVQGAIVCVARLDGVVTESDDPCFFGPFGWVLKDVVRLARPVPARGFQKLWGLKPETLEAVRDEYRAATTTP